MVSYSLGWIYNMVFYLLFRKQPSNNAREVFIKTEESLIIKTQSLDENQKIDDRVFEIWVIVYINWGPKGQTLKNFYYLEALATLREQVISDLSRGKITCGFFNMTMPYQTVHARSRRDSSVESSTIEGLTRPCYFVTFFFPTVKPVMNRFLNRLLEWNRK